MSEMINLLRGALMFDNKAFSDLKASPDVFRKGFVLVLVVGLIVGLVIGLVGMVQGLLTDPLAAVAAARASSDESMKLYAQFMPSEASRQMLENYAFGFRIAERIVKETKAPLPYPVQVVFKQLGVIVSQPISWLGSLLFYGALVHIFAKLLGGRGSIAQMLGVTSLTVVPHLLDALGFIPCLGGLLGLVAFVWGVVIYVKGTAVAHEMSMGKALLAALLPALIIIIVLIALLLIGVGFAFAAAVVG